MHKSYVILAIAILLILVLWFLPNYSLYDYLKAKRLESLKPEKKGVVVVCKTCKGTGQTEQDVNLLMAEASFTIWYNIHMASNKCKLCSNVKFCDVAQKKYDEVMSRYKEVGPKIDKAACPDCMGMGTYIQYDGYRMGKEK